MSMFKLVPALVLSLGMTFALGACQKNAVVAGTDSTKVDSAKVDTAKKDTTKVDTSKVVAKKDTTKAVKSAKVVKAAKK